MYTEAYTLYDAVWKHRDIRMDNYLLLGNPFSTIFLCLLYLIFSIWIGPWFMKNKKPYDLKKFIIAYNIVMVVVNTYLHYMCWKYGWAGKYKLLCEPVDTSNNPEALKMAMIVYVYYITKYMDWFDTMFFILRKKFTHVSVLHLYHHFIMPINTWPVARFLPGGQMTLAGLCNTFVHIVMYSYYALAALKPEWQKYLWWKKYITILQMMQFVAGLFIGFAVFFFECNIPMMYMFVNMFQGLIFLVLFTNFYIKAYSKQPSLNNVSKKRFE